MSEDIVQRFGEVYNATAKYVLGKAHSVLINWLEKNMRDRNTRELLIIGPGQTVLPYSKIPTIIAKTGSFTSLVLQDYSMRVLEEAGKTLAESAWLEQTRMNLDKKIHKNIFPVYTDAQIVKRVWRNVIDKLPYENQSFDMIDASLVLHHATPFYCDLENILRECYRTLKPYGTIHLMEGQTEMRSDKKIEWVTRTVKDYAGEVYLQDDRIKKDYVISCRGFQRKTCQRPIKNKVTVKNDGEVCIETKNTAKIAHQIRMAGYNVMFRDNYLVMPLIDWSVDKRFVNNVTEYYDSLYKVAKENGCSQYYLKLHRKALEYEEGNAVQGLVEFYRPRDDYISALKKTGFTNIELTKSFPFYNLTAMKKD